MASLFDDAPPANTYDEVGVWFKRIQAATGVHSTWEKEYRVAECYQYWRGRQRVNEMDEHGERRAQHNKIHPDVTEQLPSLYFYAPFGRVVATPERADTPGETVSEKARLLQDTGVYLVRNKEIGFEENTQNALKESRWAIACVEVGYDPDFISNPAAKRPPLKEKKDTKVLPEITEAPEGIDELGLTVDGGSDLASLTAELKRLKTMLRGETFFVKHIPANQILISPSDKAILIENDWVGYWQDYPLEDVKQSSAYQNTDDLKAETDMMAKDVDGSVDRVRLYRIWDLRAKIKYVLAKGHQKVLAQIPFERCSLKFYRPDIDPYHFFPIPPVYLKLPAQDQYNDSAEYLRKMRISSVPRWTYDEDAVEASEVAKFQTREMNVMIPRHAGTHSPIEPVNQPSMTGTTIQTLALSEKEFVQAGSATGSPLDPPSQTATRVVVANAKKSAQESFDRNSVAKWLGEIIQELILLAVENMNVTKWVAANVDMDSMFATESAAYVAQTFQQINAEKLRSTVTGITWTIEVEADTLSPVSEAERGMKLMQMLNFISNPPAAALMSRAPKILKRLMSLAGIRAGEDIDALQEALAAIVQMNMQMAAATGQGMPGVSPTTGEPAGPAPAPGVPEAPAQLPIPPGVAGA